MTKSGLEKDFDKEMMNLYHRIKSEANYNPTLFHNMLSQHGGIETACRLVHSKTPSEGYTALWEKGHLDLTVEALICDNPKWHPLFKDETLEAARKRLKEYGYKAA
jgi:hypothetical protein